jgi:chromosome segregation ATPase
MSTLQKEQEVKGLESQLKILAGKREAKKTEVAQVQRDYSELIKSEQQLKDKISAIKENKGITITEHAILRYIERVRGINLKEIEEEILTDELKSTVSILGGNGKYPLNGCRAVLKNNTIVTIEI